MRLENNEYEITDKGITISKAVLEEYRNHYLKVADKSKKEPFRWGFYVGKAEVLIDLLKHFDELEVL